MKLCPTLLLRVLTSEKKNNRKEQNKVAARIVWEVLYVSVTMIVGMVLPGFVGFMLTPFYTYCRDGYFYIGYPK
jgi:uncharacterized membrane protein